MNMPRAAVNQIQAKAMTKTQTSKKSKSEDSKIVSFQVLVTNLTTQSASKICLFTN